ncbi:30S ribosomal protein S6 [Candidatus Uhrbacteria bacterium]|nr:30S ribosomal protein S6 [Candidatus Uhrbacteria bacterium]
MQRYELLYIIPATLTDEDVGAAETTVKTILEKNGATIESVNRLGKFRLAYPIKKVRHGHYVLVYFSCERPAISKIDMTLRITPVVLRHLTLRADEAVSEKFDLVQFTEVNVEAAKEARDARRREKSDAANDDLKSGVAVLEDGTKSDEEDKLTISDEEIDKKIDAALQENT